MFSGSDLGVWLFSRSMGSIVLLIAPMVVQSFFPLFPAGFLFLRAVIEVWGVVGHGLMMARMAGGPPPRPKLFSPWPQAPGTLFSLVRHFLLCNESFRPTRGVVNEWWGFLVFFFVR